MSLNRLGRENVAEALKAKQKFILLAETFQALGDTSRIQIIWALSKGELCGFEVNCTAHGYLFDVRTGALISPRGLCDSQRTFEVTVEGDDFVVYDQIPVVLPPPVR